MVDSLIQVYSNVNKICPDHIVTVLYVSKLMSLTRRKQLFLFCNTEGQYLVRYLYTCRVNNSTPKRSYCVCPDFYCNEMPVRCWGIIDNYPRHTVKRVNCSVALNIIQKTMLLCIL